MNKFFTIALLFITSYTFCQVGGVSLSATGSLPDPSAMLDISSTNKGFLLPRISQAQRNAISNPALGLQIYDTTTKCIEVYGFGSWQTVSCLCNGAPSTPGIITGNNNPCADAPSVTYSVGLILDANTYTWTAPSDATIIAGQGTNSITVNFGASPGNVTVVANNSCGSSSASTLPVTINSIPSTPDVISGNPYPCANSTAQAYSVPAVNGATSYTWTVPSGSIVTAGQGTTSALVNFSTTPGNVAVTANNTCGSSSASSLPIAMAVPPNTPGNITGATTFNSNQSGISYSIAPVTEATTYTWTIPSDASITSGQGTDSIAVTFGEGNGKVCVTAGNCAGTSNANCITATNTCYTSSSQVFNYSGSLQTFTVPCGASSITIAAYGAQGNSQFGNGGAGGSATGTLAVLPGQLLYIYVGGQNGYNGGGAGESNSTGGGMSDVRMGGTNLINWVIVAGGGGGGGNNGSGSNNTTTGTGGGGLQCANGAGGGGGGYYVGGGASAGNGGTCTIGGATGNGAGGWGGSGGGGGLTSGGVGGGSGGYGNAGTQGQGQGGDYGIDNTSCNCNYNGAGGGGGGYYGGGGGAAGCCAGGSGGGGSSWASGSMTNTSFVGGVQSGNGQVIISW